MRGKRLDRVLAWLCLVLWIAATALVTVEIVFMLLWWLG